MNLRSDIFTWFHSGFIEPWCHLANQAAIPPVLSVIKDASSTEGVAQCTTEINCCSKMSDRIDYLQALEKQTIFCFQLQTNFSGSKPIYCSSSSALFVTYTEHVLKCTRVYAPHYAKIRTFIKKLKTTFIMNKISIQCIVKNAELKLELN